MELHPQVPCVGVNGSYGYRVQIMSDSPIRADILEKTIAGGKLRGLVVRDRAGRLRIESEIRADGSSLVENMEFPDGSTFQVSNDYRDAKITVYDRTRYEEIEFWPGQHIARTSKFFVTASGNPDIKLTCADFPAEFKSYDGQNGSTRTTQRILGVRNLLGVESIGVKQVHFTKGRDEKWQPIHEIEFWYSKEYGLDLMRVDRDLVRGLEHITEVIAIEHGDPDPSLFEIPKDYRVNPEPEDLPHRKTPAAAVRDKERNLERTVLVSRVDGMN